MSKSDSDLPDGHYWKVVGAPILRARKREIGRARSNSSIAEAIELACGKRTSRESFEHFMRGTREPYIGQLVAICSVMEIPLQEFLSSAGATAKREPLFRHQGAKKSTKPYRAITRRS